jgi:hypothetical protein
MRMLMHLHFPPEPFNTAVRDGSVGAKIQRILGAIKPEAAYFTEQDGKRGATLIVNVSKPADVPVLAEPFFLMFDAAVKFRVCMTPEELAAANLDKLGKEWRQ